MASPDREPEKRPAKLGPRVVPIDSAVEVKRQLELESDADEVFPSEGPEPPRITAFPTESHSASPAPTHHAATPGAPTASSGPNWRNILVTALAAVVLTQGGLMAYWMLSGGGLSA